MCSITLYYLFLIGARARESSLKVYAPLTHDLTSTQPRKLNKNFKDFLHQKLLHLWFSLLQT
jgi:hypothetical protein